VIRSPAPVQTESHQSSLEGDRTVAYSQPLDPFDQRCAEIVGSVFRPKPILEWAGREHAGYRLDRIRSGEGGQGVVYEGWDSNMNRKVAIKIARPSQSLQQLKREAQWTAQLRGKTGSIWIEKLVPDPAYGTMWMVMEWLDGKTVAEHIRSHQREHTPPFEWKRAFEIAIEVLATLDRVHRGVNGIAHLDIKPSNVFLTSEGEVKLIDFGVAVYLDPDFGCPELMARRGTPLYMAPELFFLDGRTQPLPNGRLCDIYSTGAMLYHMLTGSAPFQESTQRADFMAFARSHGSEPRPDPLKEVPTLPPCCREIVQKSMAISPAERYSTALEFQERLQQELRREARPTRGPSRRRALLTLGGFCVLAAAGLVANWRSRRAHEELKKSVTIEPPKLINLTFKARRNNEQTPVLWDVLNPTTRIDRFIQPGNAQSDEKDCLQLEGRFDRPVLWHILWHDTNGKWARAWSSEAEQADVLYPVPKPNQEVLFVEDTDPPGTHVIFLVSGSITANQLDALLRQPPTKEPPPASLTRSPGEIRGPGTGPGTAIPERGRYLAAVGKWLPEQVTTARFVTLVVGQK
jgi:serine/threonine protein kinase